MKALDSVVLSQNALKVLEKRYLKKNEEGKIVETPAQLFTRVAKSISAADINYGKSESEVKQTETAFYNMMTSLDFLPNSPTLMNAGRELGQLSACFVLPVGDSMESIFDAVKNAAIIHKSGGGTGFSFSSLRPSGDVVGSTKGVSSGPISFMTVFDAATEAVKQGGTRRGANMGLLRVDHPDILSFITCKDENTKLNNFNISVGITEEFMKALDEDKEYSLFNPRSKKTVQRLRAKDVFNLIVNHAWKNGEPGIVFLDRMNEGNPTPKQGEIESTNPCGEQPLLPFESCNLGSINLSKMVKQSDECPEIDWKRLKDTVWNAVHFLDNVIDMNKYPLKKIEEMTKANRKIGLGIMGWADMLILLQIPYNSERAVKLAEEVMGFIQAEGRKASSALAEERGCFPNHKESIYNSRMKVRNATVTTIAPTGTLSIIAGCSSGIEPLFAVSYVRTVLEGTKLIEVNPHFEKVAKERGFLKRELMEKIAEKGTIKNFEEIPEDVKKVFVTAHDISPMEHITSQAAFQKYVDNAVSKTVNFSHDAAPKDVEEAYILAYKLGCKGVTVYRDGSRDEQVLSTGKSSKDTGRQQVAEARTTEKVVPRKRPEMIKGATRLMKTGCGNLYVTINADDKGQFFELFTSMGKAGGCASSQSEAIGRLVSLVFRSNIDAQEVVNQLKGISCHQPSWCNGGRILSCSDAIAKAIEKHSEDCHKGNGNGHKDDSDIMLVGACPECGGAVEHEGGCAVCRNCGFTRCT
ncbi:MAG: vitamin B12-dependent ribonucleotide reductase [Nitrospiraceae bacterium]|nr:vitamin B12-dependent ribonucleotide reductase [Nitrospiraceae bacterium]